MNLKAKLLFLLVFLGLVTFYFIVKDNISKDFNKNSSSPAPSLQPLVYSAPSDWKTYTTNKIMNIHPEILQRHPGIELPTLTFRYPSTWDIKTYPASIVNMDFKFPLLFTIIKIHPNNGNTLAVEGLLPDNAAFHMLYGVTPSNLKEFDGEFWGGGHLHINEKSFEVDGKRLTLGYYTELVSALYHISPNAQLSISIDFANTDSLCQTQYCTNTKEEIKQILSSFRFSSFTKSELPNRIINESKSCESDSDCKSSECTCEAFNKNQNVKECPRIVNFCPGKPKCLYNQCLFLQTEADRP